MASLSYITTQPRQEPAKSFRIPTDESVGVMVFDISGFDDPFKDYPLMYLNFGNRKVQCVRNMDDAVLLGISDDGFLNGLLYHHLSQFYDFLGRNQDLYLVFADCSEGWDIISEVHQTLSGKAFHYGVWTSQAIWCVREDGSLGFTPLISDLEAQADDINGKVGEMTHTMAPIHILLFGNSRHADGGDVDYKMLPNAVELECPKVSVILAQNGSEEIHRIQSSNPAKAPVGCLGLVMAILSLCGAEESVASLTKGNLNKHEGFNYPEWGVGFSGTGMSNVNRIWANTVSSRGYIIPIDYEGEEASYFLSSDETLSSGSFGTIANNRVMHKSRRAMCTALIPYVNSDHIYIPGSKSISPSAITMITNSINNLFESVMLNPEGQKQINGQTVVFLDNENFLEDDSLSIRLTIDPVNSSDFLSEDVSHDVD